LGKTGQRRTEVTTEYLAGFFDGEGCVAIRQKEARLEIGHTFREVLEQIRAVYGGTVNGPYTRKNHTNWKPSWRWQISGEAAKQVCYAMLPHLREKKAQIELFLEWHDALPMGQARKDIAALCREAKRTTHDKDSSD
jgi:hypothetical protein